MTSRAFRNSSTLKPARPRGALAAPATASAAPSPEPVRRQDRLVGELDQPLELRFELHDPFLVEAEQLGNVGAVVGEHARFQADDDLAKDAPEATVELPSNPRTWYHCLVASAAQGMPMNQNEFEALISDGSKLIIGDISWGNDEDHSPSVEFRAEVTSDAGYPLFVRGSYNSLAQALSYALIHRGVGRIYALDLGKDHHNPSCEHVGEKHKHHWDERLRDKDAYVPKDVTASVTDPVIVWRQFCAEACVTHHGKMIAPPPQQLELI